MIKEKIKGLTSKIIMPLTVAGGIMAGIVSNQEFAQAQDFRIPLGLDFFINNPNIPISCNDRAFLNHINRINYITAYNRYQQDFDYNNQRQREIVIRHVHENYSVKDGKINPNSIPQVFTANYYKDFNEDGYSSLDEFVGLNKKEFKSNERAMSGIRLPIKGIKGKTLTVKIFNPLGKEFYTKDSIISSDNYNKWKTHTLNYLLNNFGEGTYVSAFYINEKFFGKVDFKLTDVESSDEDKRWRADSIKRGTFIGRWVDLDNDGKLGWSELSNKGKTEFIEGERIAFGIYAKNYDVEENYGMKIYSDSEEKIIFSREKRDTPGPGCYLHSPGNKLVPGEYKAIYELNGEVRDRRNFKIVPNEEGETKRRVIIDTLE